MATPTTTSRDTPLQCSYRAPSRDLGCISAMSRRHLGVISASSRRHLGDISAPSRRYLGDISQVQHALVRRGPGVRARRAPHRSVAPPTRVATRRDRCDVTLIVNIMTCGLDARYRHELFIVTLLITRPSPRITWAPDRVCRLHLCACHLQVSSLTRAREMCRGG